MYDLFHWIPVKNKKSFEIIVATMMRKKLDVDDLKQLIYFKVFSKYLRKMFGY